MGHIADHPSAYAKPIDPTTLFAFVETKVVTGLRRPFVISTRGVQISRSRKFCGNLILKGIVEGLKNLQCIVN
jgi:hypothetical protein